MICSNDSVVSSKSFEERRCRVVDAVDDADPRLVLLAARDREGKRGGLPNVERRLTMGGRVVWAVGTDQVR
jgi:hypothetical protein